VLRVPGGDPANQVLWPTDRVDLEHLGRRLERFHRFRQSALGELQHHERLDRMPELRSIDLRPVADDHAALLELGQPRLDGAAGDPEASRDLEQTEPRMRA